MNMVLRICIGKYVKLVPSPEADDVAVTSSQSLMPCGDRSRPTVPSSVVSCSMVSKEVLLDDESTSRTEQRGAAPGNHPQGLRSGTRSIFYTAKYNINSAI